MTNKLKNKIYINIGVISTLLLIIIIFIIYPAIKIIISINKEISQERQDLEKRASLGVNIQQTKDDLSKIKASLDKLDNIFIKKNRELEFITELENVAAGSGVNININSDFIGQKINNSIRQIPLQINVSGEYGNVVAFLSELENLPYYYNTNIIMVSPKQQDSKSGIVMQLTGQAYIKEN